MDVQTTLLTVGMSTIGIVVATVASSLILEQMTRPKVVTTVVTPPAAAPPSVVNAGVAGLRAIAPSGLVLAAMRQAGIPC